MPAVISTKFFRRRIGAWLAVAFALFPSAHGEVLTLEDCLRETAAHNPTIIAQELEVQRATGTRLTLRSRALPTLNISGVLGDEGAQNAQELKYTTRLANGTTHTSIIESQRPAQEIVLGTFDLEQPIFDASIPASWRRGTIGVRAARQTFYTVAVSELHQARTQFYRTLYEQERGILLHQTDEILAADVRTVEGLVNAGLVGRQDLLTAQVRRTNFAPNFPTSTGTYHSNLALLLQTMGRLPGTGPGGDDPLLHITLRGSLDQVGIGFDAAAVGREALATRPDILALREQVLASKEDANITRGGYYPRIHVYIAGEVLPQSFVRSNRPDAIRSTDQVQTTEVRPGGREDWTVIDTGNVRGEARRLDAVAAEMEVGLRRLETNVPGELAGVRASVDSSAAALKILNGNVNVAQDTLNIINGGVAQGINSQLEFLDAQTNVLGTRLGILDAALELTMARAEFDRISGRYLKFVTDDATAPASSSRPRR